MNPRLNRWIPAFVATAGAVIAVATLAMTRWVDASGAGANDARGFSAGLRKYDPLQRLELITYDWRARRAADRQGSVATNLGLVLLDDPTIVELQTGRTLGTPVGPLWPRFVYGLVLRELRDQGAQGVAVDILLGDERPDHGTVPLDGYTNVSSDTFFAREATASGNVILASLTNFPPAPPFRKSMLGDVDLPHDVDGTARRVNAFSDHVLMHPSIEAHARRQRLWILGVTNDAVLLQSPNSEDVIRWPINPDGSVRILRPNGALSAESVYVTNRVWHMGIALASLRLGLDLANARIEPGRILFPNTNGVITRILPVTPANQFFINWTTTTTNQSRIKVDGLNHLVLQALEREANPTNASPSDWAGKLVVIGSTATGNNMADRGATPIAPVDFLVSTYINVTDSLLRQQFVHFPPAWVDYLIVLMAALLGSALTWRLKTVAASLTLTAIGVAWIWIAFQTFDYDRLWLPMAHPLLAGLALNHAAMLTYRSIFEQNERQRVRGIFSKIVSPNVVQELLKADRISLGGARRELTVFFADVRGFTELTDRAQEAAEEHVRKTGLTGAEAEAYFEQKSTEVLQTVNLYLATIADVIKRHRGTLDKYIGDCVMAFWGAPTPNPRHAADGVCAAVDAQQSMERLNVQRDEENVRIEAENVRRASQGLPPLPLLARLALGTGINSGFMTVGLMGSDSHILNYTVFGREVNLAARLEGVSGRGRIIIGETTYKCLLDQLPKLAERCIALEPVSPKGFRQPVPIYEVPWRDIGPEEIPELKPSSNPPTTF
ncbi:MAG: CHASE2 domain-containing protein [Verrucomicrobiota bacterium]